MLSVEDLHFYYRSGQPVLGGLDLDIPAGSICGLFGLNGSGKTTLLRLISGSLRPQSGNISLWGQHPSMRDPALLAQCYMVPVEFHLPSWTVRQYVANYAPFYPCFDVARFEEILKLMGLAPDQRLQAISHGQQKKAILSFAFASGCRLLLLDEPTNGLDAPSKALFRRLVAGYIQDDRMILMATHQIREVSALVDQVIFMDGGRTLLQSPAAVLASHYTSWQAPTVSSVPGPVFYSEPLPGGMQMLTRNPVGEPLDFDLEFFFNAVMAHPELAAPFAVTTHTSL